MFDRSFEHFCILQQRRAVVRRTCGMDWGNADEETFPDRIHQRRVLSLETSAVQLFLPRICLERRVRCFYSLLEGSDVCHD